MFSRKFLVGENSKAWLHSSSNIYEMEALMEASHSRVIKSESHTFTKLHDNGRIKAKDNIAYPSCPHNVHCEQKIRISHKLQCFVVFLIQSNWGSNTVLDLPRRLSWRFRPLLCPTCVEFTAELSRCSLHNDKYCLMVAHFSISAQSVWAGIGEQEQTFLGPVAPSIITQFSLKQTQMATRSSAFNKRSDCFCMVEKQELK